jgi:hypothetical protein
MIFESISAEERISIVQQTIVSMESEIFRLCVLLGMDPDTFNESTYTYETPVVRHEYVQLKNSIDSLNNAKAMLVELGA